MFSLVHWKQAYISLVRIGNTTSITDASLFTGESCECKLQVESKLRISFFFLSIELSKYCAISMLLHQSASLKVSCLYCYWLKGMYHHACMHPARNMKCKFKLGINSLEISCTIGPLYM